MKPISNSKCLNFMNNKKEQYFYCFHYCYKWTLIVKYYYRFSTVMLKNDHLEIPTQGHIKMTCTGY